MAEIRDNINNLEVRNTEDLIQAAGVFARAFSERRHPDLYGVTDGKAVGTYIERRFKVALQEAAVVNLGEGNAARGIDLPSLNTDIKVTSLKQPQSSSPFGDFKQKVRGLGYNLMLFVYDRLDDAGEERVSFPAVRYIPAHRTADFQTTRGLQKLISEDDGNVDDVFAFLVERNIPADEAQLYEFARQLLEEPPEQGYLTVSNALQWRLQYGRVVQGDLPDIRSIEPA